MNEICYILLNLINMVIMKKYWIIFYDIALIIKEDFWLDLIKNSKIG